MVSGQLYNHMQKNEVKKINKKNEVRCLPSKVRRKLTTKEN